MEPGFEKLVLGYRRRRVALVTSLLFVSLIAFPIEQACATQPTSPDACERLLLARRVGKEAPIPNFKVSEMPAHERVSNPGRLLFLLPATLKNTASAAKKSVLQFLADRMELVRGSKFANALFLGPVGTQTIVNAVVGDRPADSMAFYNVAQLSAPGKVDVDYSLGTEAEFKALVEKANATGMEVFIDFVASQTGYLGKNRAEQAHYKEALARKGISLPAADKLPEMIEAARKQGAIIPTGSVEEQFLGSHVYFPTAGWVSRKDPAYFNNVGQVTENAFWLFETATDPNSPEFQKALLEIQTGELCGLPKLNLDNPDVLNDRLETIRTLARSGVGGFRVDAARHVKVPVLVTILKTMLSELRAYNSSHGLKRDPKIFLEYWTLNTQRISEISRTLNEQLGADAEHVYFFDHAFAERLRGAFTRNASFEEFGNLFALRNQFGVDSDRLVPVVIDHDSFTPFYDGTVQSIAITAGSYALASFLSRNEPLLYNAFADIKYNPWDNPPWPAGSFPRHQMEDVIASNTDVFRTVNSLFTFLDSKRDLLAKSDITIVDSSFNHILIRRTGADGQSLWLRIGRGPGRTYAYGRDSRVVWSYYSEATAQHAVSIEFMVD